MAEKIKITFLGTSSAVPTKRRNHSAILVSFKGENILFDCGEGTQRQFRRAGLNPCKINKIFISHWHGDHMLGLMGLFQTLALNEYNGTVEVHGPIGSKKNFSELIEPHLKFYLDLSRNEGNKFDIRVIEHKGGVVFEDEDFLIDSAPTEHKTRSLAYSFIVKEKKRLDKEKLEKLKIPNSPLIAELVKGKTVEIDGKKIDGKKLIYTEPKRKITYISDTRYNESLIEFAKDSDVLISESTYNSDEEQRAEKYFHLTCKQAGLIAKKSKSKKLVLVHLSQKYDEIPKLILSEAKKVFKEVKVAEDLDSLEI